MKNKFNIGITALMILIVLSFGVAAFTTPDYMPPLVTISSTATSLNQGQSATISVSASDTGGSNTGVNTIAILENNVVVGTKSCGGAGTCVLSVVRTYNNYGNYVITAVVTDMAGNQNTASTTSPSSLTIHVNGLPIPIISASPTSGYAPLTVSFSSGSYDPDGEAITSTLWNFGDGTTSNQASTSHAYTSAGTYTVTLTATDSAGASSSTTTTITVNDAPPVAAISAVPATGNAPLTVSFTSGSYDPDGSITATSWNFGDGTTATGSSASHTYSTAGSYTVTLTVTDNAGKTSSTTATVSVSNTPPVASISATPTSGSAPLTVSFSGTGSTDADGSVTGYSWNFGDGTTSNSATVSHTYATPGSYVVTLTVTDNGGATGTAQTTITATNTPPVASFTATPTAGNVPLTVNFASTSYDPDGTIATQNWNFGDGTSSTVTPVSHTYLTNNTYTVTLTVTDNFGAVSTSRTNIVATNNNPPIVIITSPNPPANFGVACDQITFNATATPANGKTMSSYSWVWNNTVIFTQASNANTSNFTMPASFFGVGAQTITVVATDSQGASASANTSTPFSIAPHTAPTVSINPVNATYNQSTQANFTSTATSTDAFCSNATYTWIWTDNSNQISTLENFSTSNLSVGNHTMAVFATDNYNATGSNSTSIQILKPIVPNVPPVVSAITCYSPTYNSTLRENSPISCFANASDVDDNVTLWMWSVNNSNPVSVPGTSNSTFNIPGLAPGNYTINATAFDNGNPVASNSSAATITVVANVAPTITSISCSPNPIVVGDFTTCTSAANDVDNDSINSWLWSIDGGTLFSGTNATTVQFNSTGTHTVTLTVTDNYAPDPKSTTNSTSVVVTNNLIPGVSANVSGAPQTPQSQFINTCSQINFTGNASDADNDSISNFIWIWNGNIIDSQSNTNTTFFTMPASYFGVGNQTVTAYAFDNRTPSGINSSSAQFEVVAHKNPVVTIASPTPANNTFNVSQNVFFNATAASGDNCVLTPSNFTWMWTVDGSVASTQSSFNTSTLAVGNHTVVAYATDAYGNANSASINITILPPPANQPPVITSISCSPLMEWAPITCTANASDPDGQITSWVWSVNGIYGPVAANNTFNIPAPYLGDGNYTVGLTVTDNGTPVLVNSSSINISVLNNVPNVTLTPLYPTSGPEPLNVVVNCSVVPGTGNPPYSYTIFNGRDQSINLGVGNFTSIWSNMTDYTNGTYNAYCTVTDMDGDVGVSNNVTINTSDVAPTANISGNNTLNEGQMGLWSGANSTPGVAADPIVSYAWNFGDGTPVYVANNNNTVNHTYTNLSSTMQTFTINLTVTDADGVSRSTMQSVNVYNLPPTNVSVGVPYNTQEGGNVTFVASAQDVGTDGPFVFQWDFNYDPINPTNFVPSASVTSNSLTANLTQQFNATQFSYVAVRVVDQNGLGNVSAINFTTLNVTNVAPNASILNAPYSCLSNQAIQLNGSATDPNPQDTFSYTWNFTTAGFSLLGQNPTLNCALLGLGSNPVVLTVTDKDGGASAPNVTTVTVTPASGQAIINSTIYGTPYPYNFTSDVTVVSVTNSTIFYSYITNATIAPVDITNSTLSYANFTDVPTIFNCTAEGSAINYTTLVGTSCINQVLDPSSIGYSNITGTTPIEDSSIWYSNVTYSQVYGSTITYSNINDSFVQNTYVNGATAQNSQLSNSRLTSGANVQNSNLSNVNVSNSTVSNSNITNAVIANGSNVVNSSFSGLVLNGVNVTNNIITVAGTINTTGGNPVCNDGSCVGQNIANIDTTGPSITLIWSPTSPTNLTSFTINATIYDPSNVSSATLDWNGIKYNLTGNLPLYAWPISGLTNGTYYYNITANDTHNNINFTPTYTLIVNTSAPASSITGTINSPQSNSYINGNLVSYNITGTANANNGVNSVVVLENGNPLGTATFNSGSWNYTLSPLPADGTYNFSANITDNAGNSYVVNSTNVTIDSVPPSITGVSTTSVSSSSATVSWSTNEAANSTVLYGISPSLGTINSKATFATSTSIQLTGLSSSTTYYYNVSSCDRAGNCAVNGTYNFTTLVQSIPPPGGNVGSTYYSSSGSYVSGTSGAPTRTLYFDYGKKNPETFTLQKYDGVQVVYNGTTYVVSVGDISQDGIQMTVYPQKLPVNLANYSNSIVNLNGDANSDLGISLEGINTVLTNMTNYNLVSYTANVTFNMISFPRAPAAVKPTTAQPAPQTPTEAPQPTPEVPPVASGELNVVGEVVPRIGASAIAGGAVTAAIVLVGLAGYFAFRRRAPKLNV